MPHQTAQKIWKGDQSLYVYIVENDITLCSFRKFSCNPGKIVPTERRRGWIVFFLWIYYFTFITDQ